jgi:hypothetical protein
MSCFHRERVTIDPVRTDRGSVLGKVTAFRNLIVVRNVTAHLMNRIR